MLHRHAGALAAARGLVLISSLVVVTTASVGWLYWLRAHLNAIPGPRVADALPLDELPDHASVPLLLFVLVFAVAGLVLGMASRRLGLNRISAALVLFLGTGAWMYIASVVSIFIVRQTSFALALDASRDLESIYLASTLCALGGALVSIRPPKGSAGVSVVAAAVAMLGAASFILAMFPNRELHHGFPELISHGAPTPLERTFGIVAGLLLFLSSRALSRRSRPAWTTAMAFVLVTVIFRVIAGFDDATTVFAVLTALLLCSCRQDFVVRSDPALRPNALVRLLGMLVFAYVFGFVAIMINRVAADLPIRFVPNARSALFAFAGVTSKSTSMISGGFADWLPASVLSIAVAGAVWAAGTYFAPHRAVLRNDRARWLRASEIVRQSGSDSLAPFTLRADKSLFLVPEYVQAGEERAQVLIAYRLVRGVAIMSGDPIGPAEHVREALEAFFSFVAERGWRLAVIGASERYLDVYQDLGLRALYHGDEAVLEVCSFSLEGGSMKTVRQAANRLARKGYTAEPCLAGEIDLPTRKELQSLESEWLKFQPPKGFVMELDELFRLDGEDALFVIGRGPNGELEGFLEFAVCHSVGSLSLSSMPRGEQAANGLNAFLVVEAVAWATKHGYTSLSLNFSPYARLLSGRVELGWSERLARRGLLAAKSLLSLQLDNLLMFNQRFSPAWRARYVVYERRRHLPRIAIAAMAAERYLPLTDWLRGREWHRAAERALSSTAIGQPETSEVR